MLRLEIYIYVRKQYNVSFNQSEKARILMYTIEISSL
jgi:hypothetical protein